MVRNGIRGLAAALAATLALGCNLGFPGGETGARAAPPVRLLAEDEGNLALSFTVPALPIPSGVPGARVVAGESVSVAVLLDGLEFGRLDLAGLLMSEQNGVRSYKAVIDVPVPLSGRYDSVVIRFLNEAGQILTEGSASNVAVALDQTAKLAIACFPKNFEVMAETNLAPGEAFSSTAGAIAANSTRYYRIDLAGARSYEIAPTETGAQVLLYGEDGRLIESGAKIRRSFPSAGRYWVGLASSSTIPGLGLRFLRYDLPPQVETTSALKLTSVGTANFSASATDTEGQPLSFAWSLNGAVFSTTATASRAFDATGTYTVILKVSDGFTTIERAITVYVAIDNVPPIPNAGSDKTARAGDSIQFDASQSSDPDGDDITAYRWDFGDGAVGAGLAVSHAFAAVGSYSVKLWATDVNGKESAVPDELLVTVTENRAPLARLSPIFDTITNHGELLDGNDNLWQNSSGWYTVRGLQIRFDASASSDPDASDHLAYSWAVFDPDFQAVAVDVSSDGTASFTTSKFGRYLVRATVTDDRGLSAYAFMYVGATLYVPFDLAVGTTTPLGNAFRVYLYDVESGAILRSSGWVYKNTAQAESYYMGLWLPELESFDPSRRYGLAFLHLATGNGSTKEIRRARWLRDLLRNTGTNFTGLYYNDTVTSPNPAPLGVLYDTATVTFSKSNAAYRDPVSLKPYWFDATAEYPAPESIPTILFEDKAGSLDILFE